MTTKQRHIHWCNGHESPEIIVTTPTASHAVYRWDDAWRLALASPTPTSIHFNRFVPRRTK